MANRTIWIVRGIHHYEGSSVIRAYESHAEANADSERFNEYCATRIWPDTNLEGTEWNAECDRFQAWREAHPAGQDYASADEFDVCVLELRPAKPSPEQKT